MQLCPSISSIISNVLSLVVSFTSCSFVWVRRSCNAAAHVAAKYALGSSLSFCFYKDDLYRFRHKIKHLDKSYFGLNKAFGKKKKLKKK